MALALMRLMTSGFAPVAALLALILVSLYLMSSATQNSEHFGELYSVLLVISVCELVLLVTLISANVWRLLRQLRAHVMGSRLTLRLVVMFVLISLGPVTLVYAFSLDFLRRGIDSWFDVRLERALDDALELSRTALDGRMRDLLRETKNIARETEGLAAADAPAELERLRERVGATELALFDRQGRLIAFASERADALMPHFPTDGMISPARQHEDFTALEKIPGIGLQARIIVRGAEFDARLWQALFPLPERMGELADNVQTAYARYEQLAYLRKPLKITFTFTLSMVLLLSVLAAVWAAFYFARRLAAPVRTLAIGTRAVAAGDYDRKLPQYSNDELGYLVQSFNEMTNKIALARDEAQRSQRRAEGERAYLQAVLGRLSSGVWVVDTANTLRTVNDAAAHILRLPREEMEGRELCEFTAAHASLTPFIDAITPQLQTSGEWRAEVTLFGAGGRQVLMCRGAALPAADEVGAGHVIVFDDITTLIQAQRDAAWGEVARRLAHEIKNPLTPIQLSAERLRHKYLPHMPPQEAELLDRSTHTIIQQVEVMKEMVKAFSDYARSPKLERRSVDLHALASEVLDLYRGHLNVAFKVHADAPLPVLALDPGRFRQLLHNLIKNALEAMGESGGEIRIGITLSPPRDIVELCVEDNGPGFAPELLGRLFEPYVTSKRKGSGLGLAIVKKIVEEHGGAIVAENGEAGGASVTVRLPVEVAESVEPLPSDVVRFKNKN